MNRQTLSRWCLLVALFLTAGGAFAADAVTKARQYLESQREGALAAIAAAEASIAALESDIRVVRGLEADAQRRGDTEVLTVTRSALQENRIALQKQQQNLERARALLAARQQSLLKLPKDDDKGVRAYYVAMAGKVDRIGADGLVTADDGPLRPGEGIRTGSDGVARFFLADGSETYLGSNSLFGISTDDDGSFSGVLEKGYAMIRASVRRFSKKFEVRTGSGTAAVRGTEFSIEESAGSGRLRVYEGTVSMTPITGDVAVDVTAGQALEWSEGKFGKPLPFDMNAFAAPWNSANAP